MAHFLFETSFGTCGIAWNDAGLTGFQLPGGTDEETALLLGAKDRSKGPLNEPPAWILALVARVKEHLAGSMQDFSHVQIDWTRVSAFQKAVYAEALAIKPGSKCSYGDISRALGLGPEGARAVGTALGENPWPLIVPCHRVVSATGKMTGFSAPGGIRTKTRLLAIEGAELLSE